MDDGDTLEVRVPVHSRVPEAWMSGVGGSLAGLALALWAVQRPDLPSPWWLMLVGTGLSAIWTSWVWRRPLQGTLLYRAPPDAGLGVTGRWFWISPARPHGVALTAPRMAIDTPYAVLIDARTPDGLRLWLWCRQREASTPADWLALRRALAASAGEGRSGIFGPATPAP
ncbi:hypothetical protein [uncultured Tepidimonas sp.]|uniref:hypothetical protein n=1 Tax=uncultured Tepidimonas sp. TaxID=453579 RepID=UPI002603F0E9|nr:hypothetical protein [uncultured Tepidimonas sp.]